ncbi:uncharacterized protein HMPREF1541_06523 [Cyphellophora europaea CBS 101466]|uniref:Uncharacterized protein n=1 Tax=Cyphellophora europaea (strain CBS 101466) TaxID=1220924 RepID=W2RRY5_CYPE1|nr:uncharacterized protein HMPREF1541_06523 [Cyphellophora europaea CBS 101466]ETN38488.1 hypothetical protein HMPREF1541_06523 [Cyphellophora europaea CBS 101466]
MFGYPTERVSISSPCQVTCQPLNVSVASGISNDTEGADPGLGFCTAGRFDDLTINNCAFCYSFIPQQLFIANFMQALHIECRQPPVPGEPFFPNSDAIFNETLIAGPAPPSDNDDGGGGLHGSGLAVAIALPIVGGILIFGFGCWGCWIFTRRRRRRMAASGRMEKVHEAQESAYSPVTPQHGWGADEPPREMSQLGAHGHQHSPATNRWSQHYASEAAVGEDGTPLRNSFQREDVGPGPNQLQDHDLHGKL